MNKSHILAKLTALAFSIVLVAGFVSFQAGAFDWAKKLSAYEAPATPQETPPEGEQSNSTSIPSPKSEISRPDEKKAAPAFFPGSKSLVITPGSSDPLGGLVPANTAVQGK